MRCVMDVNARDAYMGCSACVMIFAIKGDKRKSWLG